MTGSKGMETLDEKGHVAIFEHDAVRNAPTDSRPAAGKVNRGATQ
jgi:hypothetical protein